MTAKEVYEETLKPKTILIVYRTPEWHQMMFDELTAVEQNIEHNNVYLFRSTSEIEGVRADYVIAENGIPQYVLMPLLKSHFFHDNKSPAKNPS